jgi:hypothetical protein
VLQPAAQAEADALAQAAAAAAQEAAAAAAQAAAGGVPAGAPHDALPGQQGLPPTVASAPAATGTTPPTPASSEATTLSAICHTMMAILARFPPPPPLPTAMAPLPQSTSTPATHLSSYPPAIGATLGQLLQSAQGATSVSPTPTHSGCIIGSTLLHSPVHIDSIDSDSTTDRSRGLTPSQARPPYFPDLPASLVRTRPSLSEKPPKTVKELETFLLDWFDNGPALSSNSHSWTQALNTYVRQTIEYARDCGSVGAVLDYHHSAVAAAAKGRFDPADDATHWPGYTAHLLPVLSRRPGRSSFARGDRSSVRKTSPQGASSGTKRPAPSSSAPQDPCYLPGHQNHTNGECNRQRGMGKKSKGPAPATPASPT